MTRQTKAWLFAGVAAAACTVTLMMTRPQIGYDAAFGLMACEQRLAGQPNPIVGLNMADPSDLTRDTLALVSWWPPGQQMAFCALRRTGLSFDDALLGLTLGSWLVGLAAWAAYFVRVLGPTEAAAWTVGFFALFRPSHAGALIYTGGETLLWALCPLVVLVNLRALDARRARGDGPDGWAPLVWAVAGGAFATLLVVVKYSGAFITIGLGAAWIWSVWRRDAPVRRLAAWSAGAAIGIGLAIAGGLLLTISARNPATPLQSNPIPLIVVWVSAGPILGLSTTLSAMQSAAALLHLPVLAKYDLGVDGERVLAAAAVAWLLLLGIWAWATRPALTSTARWVSGGRLPAWRVALAIAVSTSAGLTVLMVRGGIISFEDRHLQYGGFLLLPFLVAALARGWALRARAPRVLATAVAVLAIGLPAANGIGNLVSQVFIRPPGSPRFGGLPIDHVIASDLDAQPWVASALLATQPVLLPLVRPAQRLRWVMDSDAWPSDVYRGVPAGGVALLVPKRASDADAAVLRSEFRDIRTWERVPLAHPTGAQLWRGR